MKQDLRADAFGILFFFVVAALLMFVLMGEFF